MQKALTAAFILFSGLLLISCQTLSKDECIAADWRVIGEQDGGNGYDAQRRFGKHVKACEKAGVIPDQTIWNEGYQRGLISFCTPLRGLSHGQSGGVYHNVCPPAVEGGFLNGYNLGRAENQKKADIRNLESRISTAEREIDDLEDKIDDGKIDEDDARRSIRRHRSDIRDWNRDIGSSESDLARVRRDIEYFRQNPNQPTY